MARKPKIKTKTFRVTVEITSFIKMTGKLFSLIDGMKCIPDVSLETEIQAIETLLKPMVKSGLSYHEKLWFAVNFPKHTEFIRRTLGRKLSKDFPYGLQRMKLLCDRLNDETDSKNDKCAD